MIKPFYVVRIVDKEGDVQIHAPVDKKEADRLVSFWGHPAMTMVKSVTCTEYFNPVAYPSAFSFHKYNEIWVIDPTFISGVRRTLFGWN